eukprot:Nk52_evm16s263 gene=Nk52_evmTU16s263
MKSASLICLVICLLLLATSLCSNATKPARRPRPFLRAGKKALEAMSEPSLKAYVSSQAQTASSRYHVAVTPDMNFNTDPLQSRGIGAGVSTITNKPDLVSGVFETSSFKRVISDYPMMTERVSKIETEEDKMNSMSTSAKLSGSGYGLTVTASASMAKKTETKKNRITFNLDFMVTHKEANLETERLRMAADPLKLLNNDTSNFFKTYGGNFYSSYRTGCYLSANLQVETDSESSMQELTAELDVAYKAGLFNVHANAKFHEAVSSFDETVHISGDFDVIGVKVDTTSISSPADVIALKDEVVEKCAALDEQGNSQIVSATYSNYLSVPHVIEQITNKDALLDMASGVVSDEEMNFYWDLRNEYAALEETTHNCATDPRLCFVTDFFYDESDLDKVAYELYKNVSMASTEVREMGSTEVAKNPELLQEYEKKLFVYANEYTAMFETFSELNINSVQMTVKERATGKVHGQTSQMPGSTILTTDTPKSINQTFHELNGQVLAVTNVNYMIDEVSKKPWVVVTSRCFNGGYAQACYDLNDILYASKNNNGVLVLDEKKTNPSKINGEVVPTCSYRAGDKDYDYTAEIVIDNPYPNAEVTMGASTGQQCPQPDVTFKYLNSIWYADYRTPYFTMKQLKEWTWCERNVFSALYQKQQYVLDNYGVKLNIANIFSTEQKCTANNGYTCSSSPYNCVTNSDRILTNANWWIPSDGSS